MPLFSLILFLCYAVLFPYVACAQSFDEAALSEESLDDMRGGFETSSGLLINFSLVQQSSINGQLQQACNYGNAAALNTKLNTQAQSLSGINNIGSMITIIRNSTDNAIIQTMNTLNLAVSNMQSIRNSRTLAPLLNFHQNPLH